MSRRIIDNRSNNKKNTIVVTSIIKNKNQILILKRSDKVKSFKRKWACISGFLEKNEDLLSRALIEIYEETKIKKDNLILRGILDQTKVIIENDRNLIVQPFCFHSDTRNTHLDWEHSDSKWITSKEIDSYELVPKLRGMLFECFKSCNNEQHNYEDMRDQNHNL